MLENFFITIARKDGRITGHGVSTGAPVDLASEGDKKRSAKPDISSRTIQDFSAVMGHSNPLWICI